jgi:hypothetical protein
MAKVVGTLRVLLAGLGVQAVQADVESPHDSLRMFLAQYGNREIASPIGAGA